jgi:hypothetical protein
MAEKINEILYKAFEDNFKKSHDCLKIAEMILKAFEADEDKY